MKDTASRIAAAAGLVLLIVGVSIIPVGSPGDKLPVALLAAGLAVLLVTALVNLRLLIAFSRKRSARHGANAVLMTVLFTAMLVVIQAISMRNTKRYDVTSNQRFTLSEQSLGLLERLDDDVTVTAFFPSNTSPRLSAETLLSMYAHRSKRFLYTMVDADRKPQMAERMRVHNGEMVVEYRANRRVVQGVSEEKLTNAILFATREVQKTVYFVTGHDEKRIDNPGRNGMTTAKRRLEDSGFIVHPLSLVETEEVPSDCFVLIIPGPKREMLQTEVNKIDAHLTGGGNALFMLDPRWPVSRLEPILARYHVTLESIVLLDEMVVVDAGEEVFDATFTKIRYYDKHPITRDFNSITIFPMARPVSIVPVEGDVAVRAQYLAVTGLSAWGETDMNSFKVGTATRDETDVDPPLAVALVAERTNRFDRPSADGASRPERTSKIVLVGDSDFATNRFVGVLGNSDFFLNSVEFLAEEEIVIPIRLKEGLGDQIFISASEGRFVFVLSIVLLPLLAASMGGYVLLKKRKA
jgi:ABC-type uncharacterized transport system involved in gliding motility auxiliary subunit